MFICLCFMHCFLSDQVINVFTNANSFTETLFSLIIYFFMDNSNTFNFKLLPKSVNNKQTKKPSESDFSVDPIKIPFLSSFLVDPLASSAPHNASYIYPYDIVNSILLMDLPLGVPEYINSHKYVPPKNSPKNSIFVGDFISEVQYRTDYGKICHCMRSSLRTFLLCLIRMAIPLTSPMFQVIVEFLCDNHYDKYNNLLVCNHCFSAKYFLNRLYDMHYYKRPQKKSDTYEELCQYNGLEMLRCTFAAQYEGDNDNFRSNLAKSVYADLDTTDSIHFSQNFVFLKPDKNGWSSLLRDGITLIINIDETQFHPDFCLFLKWSEYTCMMMYSFRNGCDLDRFSAYQYDFTFNPVQFFSTFETNLSLLSGIEKDLDCLMNLNHTSNYLSYSDLFIYFSLFRYFGVPVDVSMLYAISLGRFDGDGYDRKRFFFDNVIYFSVMDVEDFLDEIDDWTTGDHMDESSDDDEEIYSHNLTRYFDTIFTKKGPDALGYIDELKLNIELRSVTRTATIVCGSDVLADISSVDILEYTSGLQLYPFDVNSGVTFNVKLCKVANRLLTYFISKKVMWGEKDQNRRLRIKDNI